MSQNVSPADTIIGFLSERIASSEKKRRRSLVLMNSMKLLRIFSGVLAVLFVALLAAIGNDNAAKFYLNIAAIVCTSLTALGTEISDSFGFEARFKQNVATSGQLRTLKSKFELERSLSSSDSEVDYIRFHDEAVKILSGQQKTFVEHFDKAHKSK
ncbi:hypothetical protein [Sulfitobacter aestuariivivens]|uniref:Uncharacterized protein n=1 Tax=Sulfitobacter aestuariivivens TaxID=2766981 RepID=A0A927HGZ8_9RHOB|nr:hypothetical protein [Sulfitobacter aestuariivivens]MBD3665979.1 hypothetical protein [Sulfitobacter aestuariivivens]